MEKKISDVAELIEIYVPSGITLYKAMCDVHLKVLSNLESITNKSCVLNDPTLNFKKFYDKFIKDLKDATQKYPEFESKIEKLK